MQHRGLKSGRQKIYPSPKPVSECDLIRGNSIFADVIKLRILRRDHPGFIPKSNVECPYKRQQKKTRRERPCEEGSRDWSDASINQRTPRIAGNHQKLGERCGRNSSSEPPKDTNSADILILELWPSEL